MKKTLTSNSSSLMVFILTLGVFGIINTEMGVVGNIASMLTTNLAVILIARAIPAFFHPVYVSMAFSVAAASVNKEEVPKAVAKVFIGVSAGMVLGVPVTSFIARETSFTMAMLFSAMVNAIVFIATLLIIPSMPIKEKRSYGEQLRVLKKAITWYSIIVVTFINGAVFGLFSFLSDYLNIFFIARTRNGFQILSWKPLILLAFSA